MKKVLGIMVIFIIVMIFGGGAISMAITKVVGGDVDESFIYPIYGGIILLSGLIVACTVIIVDGLKDLKATILDKGVEVNLHDNTIK